MKIKNKIISLLLAATLTMSTAALSAFAADKDTAEISAKTGLAPVSNNLTLYELEASADELPASFDSADNGWVLPVRTQQENTCWAFGALSTFETLLLKNGEEIKTFSPQHANLWGVKRQDGTGWQRNEHNSGYSYIPLGYLTSQEGPVYEEDFPTTSTRSDYEKFTKTPEYVLTGIKTFNNNSSTEAIKELIYTYGAVVGNYHASGNYLSGGTSYYCSDHSFATSQLVGHCVSVIGWDDNYSKENFAGSISGTPENDGAWLFKNSWGEGANSLGGYYWISYEDVWIFDQRFGPSYAFTSYEKVDSGDKIYQNERDGATYEFTYLTDKDSNPADAITYINKFDFTNDSLTLDKVVFETTSMGADYTLYYIPCEDNEPIGFEELWVELSSGTVTSTGYICVDIEDLLLPEGEGAIGVKIDNRRTYLENKDTPGYTYIPNSIGVDEWLTSGGKLIFVPESDYGMSFLAKDGTVTDVMSFYKSAFKDSIGGTFVIKALTTDPNYIPETSAPETSAPTETPTEEPTTETPTTETPSTAVPETSVPASSEVVTSAPASSETPTTAPSTEENTDWIDDTVITYVVGDADTNNIVNVKDATIIQKHTASILRLSEIGHLAAEVIYDGRVNVKDATAIQKWIAGIDQLDVEIGKIVYYFQ